MVFFKFVHKNVSDPPPPHTPPKEKQLRSLIF